MRAGHEWMERPADAAATAELGRKLALPEVIARVLVSRGVADEAQARSFLFPEIARDLASPWLFPGVEEAVSRIWRAVERKEPIIIFGDFDVDGVCAAAILSKALAAVGGQSSVFLPLREQEGYGLSAAAVNRCLEEADVKPGLLVTVDCGIGSAAEVAMLAERGIDVVITDHHECGETLPGAAAVVNPHRGASPGAEHLCGAGVAFKVAHGLVLRAQQAGVATDRGLAGQLVVAAGLATVADIVPLRGENRLLAASAMKLWKNFAGAGLHALMNRALTRPREVPDAYTFGFVLGPRINASGRMGSAMIAYELLMTADRERARELAAALEGFNGERRGVQSRILDLAREQCGLSRGECTDAAVVVGGAESGAETEEGWHSGVAGIVASQLCEESGRPAAVIVFDSAGGGRGSARAGAEYHALEALASAGETLESFGGHARAAGFQLKPGQLERFKELFCAACAAQAEGLPDTSHLVFESWLEPAQLTCEMAGMVAMLAPFGLDNRAPRWAVRNLEISEARVMGAGAEHMSFVLKTDTENAVRAVWFKCGDLRREFPGGSRVDILFEMVESDFRGFSELELHIVDMKGNG
jgi:single-stranded-DNA-specific exonuclease